MKHKLVAMAALAACTALATGAMATPDGWTDDFDAAKAQAAKDGKSLLVHFYRQSPCGFVKGTTGRDAEAFSKNEFIEAAKKDYVLVNIGLPPRGESNPSEKMKRHLEIADKYHAKMFLPLVMVVDADGEVLARRPTALNLDPEPGKCLKSIDAMKAAGIATKEFRKAVASLEKGSPERIAKIDEVFQKIGEEEARHHLYLYDFVKERLENDKDGKFAAKYPYFGYVVPASFKFAELHIFAGKQDSCADIQAKIAETRKAIEEIKASAPKSVHEEIDEILDNLKKTTPASVSEIVGKVKAFSDRDNRKAESGEAKCRDQAAEAAAPAPIPAPLK